MAADPDEIIRRIRMAFAIQAVLAMKHVTFADGSTPEANRCERDVLRRASENPGKADSCVARDRAAYSWVYLKKFIWRCSSI
jgi:hypothetical protein